MPQRLEKKDAENNHVPMHCGLPTNYFSGRFDETRPVQFVEKHPLLGDIRASIASDERLAASLVARIKHLLKLAETETQLSSYRQ